MFCHVVEAFTVSLLRLPVNKEREKSQSHLVNRSFPSGFAGVWITLPRQPHCLAVKKIGITKDK